MHVHRTEPDSRYVVLPNDLVQNRQLSYTARGLLGDLLSRPDGWREDGKQMADSSPQGRGAIRKTLRELTAAGYYRVDKVRMPDGTVRSEAHVFDTPQPVGPGVPPPDSGGATTGPPVLPYVKYLEKVPTLPGASVDEPSAVAEPEGRAGEQDTSKIREAVATLYRVIRPEPRLRLGEAEARALAPLVAEWLERGSTVAELAQALLPGLPPVMHSPVGLLRNRLKRKLAPTRAPDRPAAGPSYAECGRCHDPVPRPGICRPCAGLASTRTVAVGAGASATPGGAARARAALHAARDSLASKPVTTVLTC